MTKEGGERPGMATDPYDEVVKKLKERGITPQDLGNLLRSPSRLPRATNPVHLQSKLAARPDDFRGVRPVSEITPQELHAAALKIVEETGRLSYNAVAHALNATTSLNAALGPKRHTDSFARDLAAAYDLAGYRINLPKDDSDIEGISAVADQGQHVVNLLSDAQYLCLGSDVARRIRDRTTKYADYDRKRFEQWLKDVYADGLTEKTREDLIDLHCFMQHEDQRGTRHGRSSAKHWKQS